MKQPSKHHVGKNPEGAVWDQMAHDREYSSHTDALLNQNLFIPSDLSDNAARWEDCIVEVNLPMTCRLPFQEDANLFHSLEATLDRGHDAAVVPRGRIGVIQQCGLRERRTGMCYVTIARSRSGGMFVTANGAGTLAVAYRVPYLLMIVARTISVVLRPQIGRSPQSPYVRFSN